MVFGLTSSQKSFYSKGFAFEETMWNHSVLAIFDKVYTFSQLNEAYNSLSASHDSLRTRIRETADGPVAFVEEYEFINFPCYSFESDEALDKWAKETVNGPMSLYGTLINCALFQTPSTSGIFIWAHHIVVDGYSCFVMADYINNYLKNEDFIPPRIQSYREYIETEEKHKSSRRFAVDREFWNKQFSENLNFNFLSESAKLTDYHSDELNVDIDHELFCKIRQFCFDNELSPASFFNAVYASYIYRTYGTAQFAIGVPVLNRTTAAEMNTIGLYMHLVPLIVNISAGSFMENAKMIEDFQMNLFRHQKFTQYDIKQLLAEKNNYTGALFDIVADFQEFPQNDDFKLRLHYCNTLSVPIELHLHGLTDDCHRMKIRYRTLMFTENDIRVMLRCVIAAAEDAVCNPHKKISELSMLSESEKKEISDNFNNTVHNYSISPNTTLYSFFEKTARENAGKICIKTAERDMTFGELCCISENLDAEIRKITDGKKSVIALIAERSVEMYSAVYGIIRGGNAYLPIDPNYPRERIEYILSNSNAAVVVCQGKFKHLAGNSPCIDMTEFIVNTQKSDNIPVCSANENDTAYVIYTSGSTGNPKGARVSHKSAVNRILWMHDKYHLGKDDVILQKTPYTFDVSVWELFWWGMVGGCLAASKPDEHFLPEKILYETQKNKVTHIHFVPSVFELFLNYLENHTSEIEKFNSVKYVFLSGEALSASLVNRFYKLYDYEKVTLHNLYGPTECAVDVTYYDCQPEIVDPVPIGKPIYNTQMHIVDKYMNLVPIGVQGELCIAGVNVGQGYLNNEALTNEKFIDNPFGEGKLYKTGDLAYWREDGNIIFCGRKDNQIKINGQRIEIGEIEVVISGVDGVDSVAVIVKKSFAKDMLVAFYTGNNSIEDSVRFVCMNKLPKYMVPSVFIHLDKLPLNKNGKLDRRILNEYIIETSETSDKELPVNETEHYVCEVFGNVLNRNDIFRNTDFFDIGGTSLSMISVLSEKGFENITAAEFMRNSSPAQLSVLLNSKDRIITEYLEPLYVSDKTEKILILLPFAGGGAEAFSLLVNSLKKKNAAISVYYVRYLHSFEECKKAADEIAALFKESEIMFYSHCVGSAVALQIIKELEMKEIPVKHYFAGASIPPAKAVRKNLWNIVPDNILKTILTQAGADISGLSDEKLKEMLTSFRRDTDFSNVSFAQLKEKIKTPVSVIISKKDMFTRNYRQARFLWEKYADNVEQVYLIESDSHYFQSESSDSLIEIVIDKTV